MTPPFPALFRSIVIASLFAGLTCGAGLAQTNPTEDAQRPLLELLEKWRHVRSAEEKRRLNDQIYEAAMRADRPEIAEQTVAGGRMETRRIRLPHRGRRVGLRAVHTFKDVEVKAEDADTNAPNQGANWLARRITAHAVEIWTPTHGWLFDGKGRLLNEAHPPRRDCGEGREWYGAFLPDGRWVTTELTPYDNTLWFFSREGTLLRGIPSVELAAPEETPSGAKLLGWARSDRRGEAWVVNVGSEAGYATVRVGPEGAARRLLGTERWQECYPRALGPRGWYIEEWTPDDDFRLLLAKHEAGHGMHVGYPSYSLATPKPTAEIGKFRDSDDPAETLSMSSMDGTFSVPFGNDIFGFWPGRRDLFIGALRRVPRQENATWFFTGEGAFQGWLRGRRIADAADGRAMLFRLEGSSYRVVTLRPDLRAARTRRFTWPDGSAAQAYSLFDDLKLGLFRRGTTLVLAAWRAE